MASVSTTNKMNMASSIRGYGGLASGLDRDSLIEGMTASTRAKIAKQKQGRQTLLWKQEAYQSVSSKLVEFAKKYTSYTNSSTNLSSPSLWAKSSITSNGVNGKYISVTGSSSITDTLSVVGVKQMAQDATALSNKEISDGKLLTGDINFDKESVSTIEGGYLSFKYGSKSFTVNFKEGVSDDGFEYDYSSGKKTVESIVRSLKEVPIGNGKTLADVIAVSADPEDAAPGAAFKLNMKSTNNAGNTLELTGGSSATLKAIGYDNFNNLPKELLVISKAGFLPSALNKQSFFEMKSFAERVGGKSITFTYNGSSKAISFASTSEIETMVSNSKGNDQEAMLSIAKDMQNKLDKQFGTGRMRVGVEQNTSSGNYNFSFETLSVENFSFDSSSFAKRLADKDIVFTYKGVSKDISFLSVDEIDQIITDSAGKNDDAMNSIAERLKSKLDNQFGKDKINVTVEKNASTGEYQFNFIDDENNTVIAAPKDKSSILSISYADSGVLGKNGAMKVESGSANRLRLDSPLSQSGLNGIKDKIDLYGNTGHDIKFFSGSVKTMDVIKALGNRVNDNTTIDELKALIDDESKGLSGSDLRSIKDAIDNFGVTKVGDLKVKMNEYVSERQLDLTINGQKIEGLSYTSSINDIVNRINKSDAGVKISYMKNLDKFSILSTVNGAAGSVNITGDAAKLIFGEEGADYSVTKGQDAIVAVKYAGSQKEMEIVRGSNTFNMDGLNITVNGTFGYKGDSIDSSADPVTLSAKTNSEQIVTAVSDMIKDFNEIIKLVNDQVSTKPNRDYMPLTDEQKKEMSEDQIKTWEEKAKAGMLFNDSDLRSLSDKLRFIFDAGSDEKAMLSSFGISTSTNYNDKGKLVLDETKFKNALEKNSEDLQKLFTKTSDSLSGSKGGFMSRLTEITDQYASISGARKGILIEKAGSTYAPTSILSNYLQKSIDSVDTYVKRLQSQLSIETDRYIKQFTNLENVISQMNSQSSWLSSFGG